MATQNFTFGIQPGSTGNSNDFSANTRTANSTPAFRGTSGPSSSYAGNSQTMGLLDPNQSLSTGQSQGGVQTPNNMRDPNEGMEGYGYWSRDGWVSGVGLTDPELNPQSVNIQVDETIPSDALNEESSYTKTSENRAAKESDARFSKEEEQLMQEIGVLRSGIADLESTQAREYYDLKQNPEGVFGGVLGSQLNRLSEEQAIELNARTGQLNAYLDTLGMYQGYRPEMVGSPQIDESTGEAFAFIQDPMTGEISTQSLGQVMEPVVEDESFTLSKGQIRYERDPETGEIVPVAYGGATGDGTDSGGGGIGMGGIEGGGFAFRKAQQGASLVDEALTQIEGAGTGLGGLFSLIPGTDTKDFNETLKSIKANIGFQELAAMREASKTGGALGQVSERENDLLQSVLGSLSIYQKEETLKQNLNDVKRSFKTITGTTKIANGITPTLDELNSIRDSYAEYGYDTSEIDQMLNQFQAQTGTVDSGATGSQAGLDNIFGY